jgi:putative redox protein
MKASAQWVDGRMFVGESGSGHSVVMDGAPDAGGRNAGIRPMEMLLIGLAGCTAFDVVHILEKGRDQVAFCRVEVEAERAATDPKIFTKIHLRYRIGGTDLARAKAERAVQLSEEKYCSATAILARSAEITHEVILVDEG